MSTGIIEIIKEASIEAMHNSQMCDLRFGKVVSISPIRVQITNQFTIPPSLLIVPKHLTDYMVEITENVTEDEVEQTTPGDGEKKKIIIHNSLKVGDKVALLRKQGGQSYFILDRI